MSEEGKENLIHQKAPKEVPVKIKPQSKVWIAWAVGAAICFTLCNAAISEITSKVGPLCIFYFSVGGIVTGLIYHISMSIYNCRKTGQFWNDQNLRVKGKVKGNNVVGFIIYCLIYFLVQNLAFLTMYFAALAQINVGLITTIWSINPLFIAIMDYLLFRQKLRYYHLIGTVSIVICTVVLSLSGVLDSGEQQIIPVPGQAATTFETKEHRQIMQTWVPVLFGIITPMSFTANGMLTKHLCSEKMGFNPNTMSYSAYFIVNFLVIIVAIPYWHLVSFDHYLFWVGTIGSIINTVGIVCIMNAISKGPAGPASALAAVSNLLLVLIEAIKYSKVLKNLEIIGLIFGTFGALILVVPRFFEYIFCFCCLDAACLKEDNGTTQIDESKEGTKEMGKLKTDMKVTNEIQ